MAAALDRMVGEHESLLEAHTKLLSESDSQLTMLAADLAGAVAKSSELTSKLDTAEVRSWWQLLRHTDGFWWSKCA